MNQQEQEQQLINEILLSDNERAAEVAMLMVNGIDLQLKGHHKKILNITLNSYTGERNDEGRIALNDLIPLMWEEKEKLVLGSKDVATMLVLYHFHPLEDDNYLEFNEPLGGFEPEHADERISFLLDGSSINDEGEPQLSDWYDNLSSTNSISFFLSLVGDCPADLSIDESLRARNITKLNVSSLSLLSISGLHKMTELTTLQCDTNQITSLDVSQNTALTKLICENNQLTTLDVSQNTELIYLWCSKNQLTTLDVSQNTALTKLVCENNQLTTLDVSQNTELTELVCENNQLTTLDVSQNTELIYLWCSKNQLTTLDVSQNTVLTKLVCENNQLTTLDVRQKRELTELVCIDNQLTTLDVSQNRELTRLLCSKNQLTTLDVSQNTALTKLDCSFSRLSIEQEELIQAILRIDHTSAPKVAMVLVQGIDQSVDNKLRKAAEVVKECSSHHPEVKEITDNLNRHFAYIIKGTTDNEFQVICNFKGDHPIDFTVRVLALLYFHPNNQQEFIDVETIGGFEPENRAERMQQAIPIFIEGISNGKWKLKDYPRELQRDHEIIIAELGQRAESFLKLNINFRADHDFQRAALGNLNIVDLIQEYKILEKEAPQYNAPGYKEYQEKRKAISADVKRSVNRGYILEHVDEELKDFEFVRDVIRNDGSALKFAGSWQKTEEILVEAILAMVRYSGLHWDFSLYYDDSLEDTLREYLDVLQEIGKNGNNAIYEKLLDGLFFEGKDEYSEGYPLRGIDDWEDKYAISWYDNKALGILIYRLVLDCPADAEIHHSLNWDNLCRWFIFATENVGDGIEGHDGHKHLNMVAPKEFFTSWKYIKWLFEFGWDDVPLFCVCDDYVFNQVPNDKFSDKQFLCNVLMSCRNTSASIPQSKLAFIGELANDDEVLKFIKRESKLVCLDILEKINSPANLSSSQFAAFPDIQLLKRSRSFVDVKVLKLNDCKSLMSIQNLSALDFLEELQLNGCISLETLDGLENLQKLKRLELNNCSNLKSLKALESLSQLEFLYLNGCSSLETLEGLAGMIHLTELELNDCTALHSLHALPYQRFENLSNDIAFADRMQFVTDSTKYLNWGLSTEAIYTVKVKRYLKNMGFAVSLWGMDAFLPLSECGEISIMDPETLLGKKVDVKLIEARQEYKNIIFSRKALIESEDEKFLDWAGLEPGQVLEGLVKNITSYGVFVDVGGGVDGLINIADLAWGWVNHPEEIVKLGQVLNVVILFVDDEKKRIDFGLKQLQRHPWESLDANLKVGDKVKGKVVHLAVYGALIEIASGIEGLIHVSEMSRYKERLDPQDVLNVGDEIEAQVLVLDREERLLSLRNKETMPDDPWSNLESKFPLLSAHQGVIVSLQSYGVWVELEKGVVGLVQISNLSMVSQYQHPSQFFSVGEPIEVFILKIDRKNRRISLSVDPTVIHKQLITVKNTQEVWQKEINAISIGNQIECEIIDIKQYGVYVKLTNGLVGLIKKSQIREEYSPTAILGEFYSRDFNKISIQIGQTIKAKITAINHDKLRINLSVKKLFEKENQGYGGDTQFDEPFEELVRVIRVVSRKYNLVRIATKYASLIIVPPYIKENDEIIIEHCEEGQPLFIRKTNQ
jgi:small subunit ribosomal protein S1